ncbi:MAG TPA: molybdopterin-synthase adenylyltransferase MoeB [Gemmatimonadales bacterium]|jgi:adenylyltransferase/sulfurtransferase
MTNPLTPPELLRYARHLTLAEIGVAGQERLRAARVLLIGAGGLGSPAALYLAASGVGVIGIVDSDRVDLSNLQRQVLHDSGTVGMLKTESAAAHLLALNPHVAIESWPERLTSANARPLIRQYDLVLDGSDNFPTRYLVNDACVLEQVPLISGSILRFDGQLSIFAAPGGPCYRCLFREPPPSDLVPSCADAGVVGVLPGIIGSLQALEAIKWIVGIGDPAVGRLLLFDALALRFREIAVQRDPECVVCGDAPTLTELIDYDAFCGVDLSETATDQVEIAVAALRRALAAGAAPFLLDVREEWEFAIAHIDDATLVPLGELAAHLGELPRHGEIVTICHHGMRSVAARDLLVRAGFASVRSLAGGIDAWATDVDRTMPRY